MKIFANSLLAEAKRVDVIMTIVLMQIVRLVTISRNKYNVHHQTFKYTVLYMKDRMQFLWCNFLENICF